MIYGDYHENAKEMDPSDDSAFKRSHVNGNALEMVS